MKAYGSVTGTDEKVYKTVVIGTQTWMAENLNYEAEDSKCYNDEDSNCGTYGRLYNWPTAMAYAGASDDVPSRVTGICPWGWHIPSRAEWEIMTSYIGGNDNAGKKLKATSGWYDNGNGTDDYGFSALPGGSWDPTIQFAYSQFFSIWWSASEYNDAEGSKAYYFGMMYNSDATNVPQEIGKSYMFNVRCVKD